MRLYLVRHGEAKHPMEDPERGLTERGRRDVESIAARLEQMGVEVEAVRHSGKKRAEETATILASRLAPPGALAYQPGLAPDDPVEGLVDELRHEDRSLMLVGHLPFMGLLASLLLTNDPLRLDLRFGTATVACLEGGGSHFGLSAVVVPTG